MEQPPGSRDDLQPQDLSVSGVASVADRTRNGDDRVLSSAALDALRAVKSPGWYPNSGTGNPGLQISETGSSDAALQSGDQIQPDNAFSHTTVTLSYVSRSRVFSTSTHDSLSQRSPLYSLPPISKFSLHPPRDADKGLGETGYALNQRYLEPAEGPVDLASRTELFQSLSRAQEGPENDAGGRPTRRPREFNGVVSSDGDVEKPLRGEDERSLPPENGEGDGRSSPAACAESSPETLPPVTGEDEETGGCEVVFLASKEPSAAVSDFAGARDLCSLSREYVSPLEDPVSPSATSLDNVEDVFVLPQASSSPSGDNSYLDAAEDVSSGEGGSPPSRGVAARPEPKDDGKRPAGRQKAALEPLIDLTGDVCASDVPENKPKTAVPHMNGNAKATDRTLKEKKLPMRPGRGTRLEAIVMNINSGRYKVSGCIRSGKKANAPRSKAGPKRNNTASAGKRSSGVKASRSVNIKQKAAAPVKRGKSRHLDADGCKESTSDSLISDSKKSQSSSPPNSPPFPLHTRSQTDSEDVGRPVNPPRDGPAKSQRKTSSRPAAHDDSTKEPELLSRPDPSGGSHVARLSPPPPSTSPKKSKAKSKAPAGRTSPAAKTKVARTPKRRRKKRKPNPPSSMFGPKEPEIKLRYVNYKEERRDARSDGFSPYVRVERRSPSPSLCTVINYPEEALTQHKKGQQQQQAHAGGFDSAVVPSTSCLRLGRASTHSRHQRSLVCCLCGQATNAMDLGDLHGPYYPDGYRPGAETPAGTSGLKEEDEDYSDSDSSCSVRGRGRKGAAPPAPGARPKQGGLPESRRRPAGGAGSPAAKRARPADGPAAVEDWYSPPVLPHEPREYWLHEDCGVWSAGVFLVKGRVYGLEEAVKVAHQTRCSACHHPGPTLGCFFKGCPNKYHYRCALESDCVLIEENFSMKCKKHKNKTFKAPPGTRWDDR
ncbi:retinoic acid-induced protein 1 [Brachyistius frenatus]|uniref:retinoic acid-induced protein 1 n=1 Tax=Brachyistius frenatus TaxID=100188 RepID=UPI0037E7883A